MDRDSELVGRCLSGDRKAFEQLVLAYQRKVVTVIWRIVRNRDTALDLAQDVFLKVFQRLTQFDRRRSFSTWLHRIAVNRAIDFMRSQRVTDVSVDNVSEEALAPASSLSTDILEDMQRRERSRLVNQAMDKLPERYRMPLWLRFHEGLAYAEAAEILALPVNTVKVRVHRGLKQLHEILTRMSEEYNHELP
ncbi:sigma-70 family RNA polymerase sigma factor [bacterium]|nr:sigma-70 family RNA polymerase sigma factor [candidate division CSSED10-310 bacterium]